MDGNFVQSETDVRRYPLLFEMLRSFTTLAETLNLSHAVTKLGSTRQTVRRHITQLEEMKGGPLFDIVDRQYSLSNLGRQILPEALDLLSQAEAWVMGQSRQVNGLQHLSLRNEDGWYYFQQQHPIGKAFASTSEIVPKCLRAWSESAGDIENEAMKAVRPKCMVFRRSEGNWLFTEVGEESSVAVWFGWKVARSTIGKNLGGMPGGMRFDSLSKSAYSEVERTQSMRLDHCFTIMPNPDIGGPTPIAFERLLLGSRFADGSFAMVSVVRLTHELEIQGVTDAMLREMPEQFVMN